MEYGTDKGKEKGEYNPDEVPTIRIILKSQETKNLEYVANTIVKNAKEKQFEVKGPKFMPNKHLSLKFEPENVPKYM